METIWPHRTQAQRSQAWIDRQLSKISEALRAMSQGLAEKPYCSGAHLSLSDIAVGCAVGYLDFRFPDIAWRSTYPNLDKLYDKLMQRQSFIDSLPK
jgi:glutathione S-transferase